MESHTFLYRCPTTSHKVQGLVRGNACSTDNAVYETVTCLACNGVHHHVGPGVRYVLSGELTFTEGGNVTIYRAGDYFFETGSLAHTADNNADVPLRILFVELLPKDWTGPTVIPPTP